LFEEYFVEPNLSPDVRRGTFALALPEELILAKPETLSRGDKVFFFHGKSCVTSACVSSVTKENAVEVIVTREQAAELSSIVAAGVKFMLIYQ